MIPTEFLRSCIDVAQQDSAGSPISRTTSTVANLDSTEDSPDGIPPHSLLDSDSYFETHSDYYGFPSNPVSVYHTGDPWKRPTGPEAQRVPKEARPICEHPIADVWHELGQQVYEYLDSVNVTWSTIDPVRFADVGKDAGPLFLWVGVKPGTLSREHAVFAAVGCKKILEKFKITDVEIAFRESLFTRSAGPQLLQYVSSVDATAEVRGPLTPALGLPIAARATPHVEGFGGIYICEGGESKRVFVLTARHVVLPPSGGPNELYTRKKGQPRRDVLVLGRKAYQDVLRSIMGKIGRQSILVDHYKDELEYLRAAGDDDDDAQAEWRKKYKVLLEGAENAIETLDGFHSNVTKNWTVESERIMGHVVHSPPLSVGTGPKRFTEDWALIELHGEKIDWEAFKGNVIDLGTKILPYDFMLKMYPNAADRTSFKYPRGRLFHLLDVVEEPELRHPTMLDANGEVCFIVVKNGNSTGVTIGRATGIESFVREYDKKGVRATSMELAIYSYGHKDGAFSAPGDSGAIIADGKGGIVGIITGGAGQRGSIDVTYASPFQWVFNERIKASFPNTYLYPPSA
ncbi:hypothetical protein BD410DRAFT_534844 [Rickenella mellea]|uniref:Peptidase S1 domain-containing protein n=1 Tax=Rickenella mellea TaxID=50990 RepID=A0A4Y7PS34_9AGAM|nr:hypothetical protein BD410DRAFT_534844 [Rickenella mellea]